MIHTLYSNSYRVLRELLKSNIREQIRTSLTEALSASPDGEGVGACFEQAVVATGSAGVAEDLTRFFAHDETLSSWVDLKRLSTWQGDQVYGSYLAAGHMDAVWVIYGILKDETFVGRFDRLRQYLTKTDDEGVRYTKSDGEIFSLAARLYSLLTMYFTHRPDWLFSWLLRDDAKTLPALQTPEWRDFARALEGAIGRDAAAFFSFARYAYKDEKKDVGYQRALDDLAWQSALFIELCRRHPTWAGLKVFTQFKTKYEALLKTVQSMKTDAHVVLPFDLPPNFLTTFRAMAGMPRTNDLGQVDDTLSTPNLWFYVLNPSGDFWFDWAFAPEKTDGSLPVASARPGNPLLMSCGRSTRAVIDRLWRFTAADVSSHDFLFEERDDKALTLEEARGVTRFEDEAPVDTFQYVPPRLESVPFEREEVSLWGVPPETGTLLQGIQRAIFKNTTTLSWGEMPLKDGRRQDQSFTLLKAPTATREVDAVMEAILTFLNDENARSTSPLGSDETGPYRPEDIVVLTPNLDEKASLIKRALFSLEGQGRGFPARVVGESLLEEDAMSQAVLALLNFVLGRAENADFKALLGLSAVREALGLSEDDVKVAGAWLDEAGYRFGLSDAHLDGLDASAFSTDKGMNLTRTLERLLLSELLPEGSWASFDDVMPMSGERFGQWVAVADRPELLHTLLRFVEGLEAVRCAAAQPNPLVYWHGVVASAIETLLTPTSGRATYSNESILKILNRVCLDGVETAPDDEVDPLPALEVPLSLVRDGIERLLKTQTKPLMRTDAVTFADMNTLRGVASPVVIIFGLDEESHFPGVTRTDEFDLISQFPRRGDRDRRQDNANLFLDALLSAERELILSYVSGTGSAQKDPCSLVSILTDWLDGELEKAGTQSLMPYRHSVPLSVKDARNFSSKLERFQSHNPVLCEAIQTEDPTPVPPFGNAGLVLARTLSVDDLGQFVKNPEGFALKRLGLRADGLEEAAERYQVVDNDYLTRALRLREAWTATTEGALTALQGQWVNDPTLGVPEVRPEMVAAIGDAMTRLAQHYTQKTGGRAMTTPQSFWVEFDAMGPLRAGWGEPLETGKEPTLDETTGEPNNGTLMLTGTLSGGTDEDPSGLPNELITVYPGCGQPRHVLGQILLMGLVEAASSQGLTALEGITSTVVTFEDDKKAKDRSPLVLKALSAWQPVDGFIVRDKAYAALMEAVKAYFDSSDTAMREDDETGLAILMALDYGQSDDKVSWWRRGLSSDEIRHKSERYTELFKAFEAALHL